MHCSINSSNNLFNSSCSKLIGSALIPNSGRAKTFGKSAKLLAKLYGFKYFLRYSIRVSAQFLHDLFLLLAFILKPRVNRQWQYIHYYNNYNLWRANETQLFR
jgi:hypothetical protein